MRRIHIGILALCLLAAEIGSPVRAQMVTTNDALRVARNWITLVIAAKGNWNGQKTATVTEVKELTWKGRLVGFVCPVQPSGFVLVSLHRALQPVRAYSVESRGDFEQATGMAGFLREVMFHTRSSAEQKAGPIQSARTEDLQPFLERNHRAAWQELTRPSADYKRSLDDIGVQNNYVTGGVLLTSDWHQHPPYNNQCPNLGCSWPDYGNYNADAVVGCVATAAGQIMRYWSWPPYGSDGPTDHVFDWGNMLDRYIWRSHLNQFMNGSGVPCTQAQIDAVAKLCREIGDEAGMDYGCDASTAWMGDKPFAADMRDAYQDHFRYSEPGMFYRAANLDSTWWAMMKDDLNQNRPIQYGFQISYAGLASHSLVCDGWEEYLLGASGRFVHMNYGWTNSADNTYYSIDELPDAGGFESMIGHIVPSQSLGAVAAGFYARDPSFPYRYFDQDCSGQNTSFAAGQGLQTLPGVTVNCTGGSVRIEGTTTDGTTRLFTRGDQSRGIKIINGALRLNPGGSLRLP